MVWEMVIGLGLAASNIVAACVGKTWLGVENRSGQSIKCLMIAVEGTSEGAVFNDIAHGTACETSVGFRGDSRFHIFGVLEDESRLNVSTEYYTLPLEKRVMFIIHPGGVVECSFVDLLQFRGEQIAKMPASKTAERDWSA